MIKFDREFEQAIIAEYLRITCRTSALTHEFILWANARAENYRRLYKPRRDTGSREWHRGFLAWLQRFQPEVR